MDGSVGVIFPSTTRAVNQGVPVRAGKQITPQSLQKEHGSADTSMLAQGDPWQTPDLPDSKRINVCSFKPPSLWHLVKQPQESRADL